MTTPLTVIPVKPQLRFRDTAVAFLTWFAADAVAGIAVLLAALALLKQKGHHTPAEILELLPRDFTFVITLTTASALVALSVLWRYAKRSSLKSLMTFFPPVRSRTLMWAAVSGLIVVVLEAAGENAIKLGLGIPLPIAVAEQTINPTSWSQLGVVIVTLALIAPLLEEILFRGFILGWLKSFAPVWLAVAVSAALFAAVHGLYAMRGGFSGWFGSGEIFAIGVLLGWWAVRTGSLRSSFVAHAAINTASFALGFALPGFYP